MESFSFDVRTINMIIAVECLSLGFFLLFLKIATPRHKGVFRWSFSLSTLGLGFFIYALGLWHRPWLSSILVNVLFIVSASLQFDGARAFRGMTRWKNLYIYLTIPLGLAISFITTFLFPSPALRVSLSAIVMAILHCGAAWQHLHNAKNKERLPQLFLSTIFILNALFHSFRAIMIHSGPTAPFARQNGTFPGASLLVVGASALLWTLGYLLLMAMYLSNEVSKAEYERSLRQNDIFLRKLIDNIPYAIVYKDANGRIVLNNRYFADSLEKTDEELAGICEANLFPAEIVDRREALDRQATEMGRPVETLEEYTDCTQPLWLNTTRIPIYDEQDNPNGILSIVRDITEEIQSRRALEESEQRLRELSDSLERRVQERTEELSQTRRYIDVFFDVSLSFLCVTDREGTILKLNPSWFHEFGWREDEVIGTNITKYAHPDDREKIQGIAHPLFGNKRIDDFETRIMRSDGSFAWLSWSACFVKELDIVVCSAHDVSSRVETEEQLRTARREAERTSWAKTQLIDTISHELRTPLNAVLGYAALLDAYVSEDRGKHYLASLNSAGRSLLAIINDILDLSRAETGRLELRMVPFDPRRLLHDIHDIFRFQAEEKGLHFALYGRENLPGMILLDVDRLRQVLINLTGNALKFTDTGAVSISMEAQDLENTRAVDGKSTWKVNLSITIEDSGIGISEEYHRHLFEPFSQQDAHISREYGGTGLGLAIAKRLVDLMGGSISCESPVNPEINRGTRFRIDIPGVVASGNAFAGETAIDDNGQRLLAAGTMVSGLLSTRSAGPISHRDELTGLQTRRSILTRMHMELNRMQREGACLGLIICDIDRLKHVNDLYGHAAGDTILQSLALLLTAMADEDDVLGRWGGDEFIIMLPRCSWERLQSLGQRIVEEMKEKKFYSDGQSLQTAVSVGASMVHPAEGSPAYVCSNALVRSAEDAVHRAKARGRNCWEYLEVSHLCGKRGLPSESSLFQ